MASVQERLQLKRLPLDNWSVREKLCLAFAVSRSGDQNWMSVSRSLKILCGNGRPNDWFSQKSCAAQYGKLLENVETPKRKKRTDKDTSQLSVETPTELILKKLKQERIDELERFIQEECREYNKTRDDIIKIKNGEVTDMQLRDMWTIIEKENFEIEKQKRQRVQWLKEREERRKQWEKNWRTSNSNYQFPSQSKLAQTVIKIEEISDVTESATTTTFTPATTTTTSRQGVSPLLTSLLKSPSAAPNPNTSLLHSGGIVSGVITNINTAVSSRTAPMITNLLTGCNTASIVTSPIINYTTHQNAFPIPFQSSQTLSSISLHQTLQPSQIVLSQQAISTAATTPLTVSSPSAEYTTVGVIQSPSQAAPTLSLLLDRNKEQVQKMPPPLARIESQLISHNQQQPQLSQQPQQQPAQQQQQPPQQQQKQLLFLQHQPQQQQHQPPQQQQHQPQQHQQQKQKHQLQLQQKQQLLQKQQQQQKLKQQQQQLHLQLQQHKQQQEQQQQQQLQQDQQQQQQEHQQQLQLHQQQKEKQQQQLQQLQQRLQLQLQKQQQQQLEQQQQKEKQQQLLQQLEQQQLQLQQQQKEKEHQQLQRQQQEQEQQLLQQQQLQQEQAQQRQQQEQQQQQQQEQQQLQLQQQKEKQQHVLQKQQQQQQLQQEQPDQQQQQQQEQLQQQEEKQQQNQQQEQEQKQQQEEQQQQEPQEAQQQEPQEEQQQLQQRVNYRQQPQQLEQTDQQILSQFFDEQNKNNFFQQISTQQNDVHAYTTTILTTTSSSITPSINMNANVIAANENMNNESSVNEDQIDETLDDSQHNKYEEQQLMAVFNELIPDNIDELADILTANNAMILNSDMLGEDAILDNVESLIKEQEKLNARPDLIENNDNVNNSNVDEKIIEAKMEEISNEIENADDILNSSEDNRNDFLQIEKNVKDAIKTDNLNDETIEEVKEMPPSPEIITTKDDDQSDISSDVPLSEHIKLAQEGQKNLKELAELKLDINEELELENCETDSNDDKCLEVIKREIQSKINLDHETQNLKPIAQLDNDNSNDNLNNSVDNVNDNDNINEKIDVIIKKEDIKAADDDSVLNAIQQNEEIDEIDLNVTIMEIENDKKESLDVPIVSIPSDVSEDSVEIVKIITETKLDDIKQEQDDLIIVDELCIKNDLSPSDDEKQEAVIIIEETDDEHVIDENNISEKTINASPSDEELKLIEVEINSETNIIRKSLPDDESLVNDKESVNDIKTDDIATTDNVVQNITTFAATETVAIITKITPTAAATIDITAKTTSTTTTTATVIIAAAPTIEEPATIIAALPTIVTEATPVTTAAIVATVTTSTATSTTSTTTTSISAVTTSKSATTTTVTEATTTTAVTTSIVASTTTTTLTSAITAPSVITTAVTMVDDTDDEIRLDVTMKEEDKVVHKKRDYTRKRKSDLIEKNIEEYSSSDDTNKDKTLTLIKLKDRDRSSSPYIDDDIDRLSSNSTTSTNSLNSKRRRRFSSTLNIDSYPNSPTGININDDRDYRAWKKCILKVYNRLLNHKYSTAFLRPIPDEYVNRYKTIILRPMDLPTIKRNIDNGIIRTTPDFLRDILLMCTNAIVFNCQEYISIAMAKELMTDAISAIEIYVDSKKKEGDRISLATMISQWSSASFSSSTASVPSSGPIKAMRGRKSHRLPTTPI